MSYSHDLRVRVLNAYESGLGTRAELSKLFQVGTATMGRWIRRYRESGQTDRHLHGIHTVVVTDEGWVR